MRGDATVAGDASARVRPGAGTALGTFFYMWLLVGLVLGTIVLVGPVRYITQGMGRAGWEQSSQDHVLIVVILLYLVLSLVVTRWIVGIMFRARSRNTRWGIAAIFTLLAVATAWEWSDPQRLLAGVAGGGNGGTYSIAGGAQFIFGAYPDDTTMERLKKEGVTAVISLQHPGVIIEREGISAERDEARKLNLQFIQAPMLPWVSDNEASLNKLREIARTGKGRYYVHCGLGRDRVTIAKRVIEAEGRRVALSNNAKEAKSFGDRPNPFERGSLAHLDNGKWLIPYPNNEEMYGFVIAGDPATIVSLLDPADPQQAAWNASMETQFKQYAIPFLMRPLPATDLRRAAQIAKEVQAIPDRVTVIAPQTPLEDGKPSAETRVASAFLKAYGAIAPKSFAASPTWVLNHAAAHIYEYGDTTSGTADEYVQPSSPGTAPKAARRRKR
ncbi:MAG TPA: hypothetical protein VE110_11930 [Gemmatimonadaceae bacterium]|nr:hypothetical protein [Gemmatimonadaceae bacterium]